MRDYIFEELREEYEGTPLDEGTLAAGPIEQFQRWFGEATAVRIPLANGMTLATVDEDGAPSARIVLLKAVDARGFVFFTNYESRKGRELDAGSRAALVFWWAALSRQVRIEGSVERVSVAESDEYFATRPRESNLSAMASPQSRPVENRAWLSAQVDEVRQAWADKALERPVHWGGYRVLPHLVEFWQGRRDRLHDRLCYLREGESWKIVRLAP
jgi:pyridoxamine 5'-phosphate oxidase